MNIDLIFKIAAIGIIVAILNILLKKAEREEQANNNVCNVYNVWYSGLF